MDILNREEILPGDIVVFKVGEHDLLGEIIGYLTNSRVSHAGMIVPAQTGDGGIDKRIIDAGDKGIRTYPFYDCPCDAQEANTLYILRHPQHHSIHPVIKKAQGYLDAKMGYNMPALFLLAGLLVYRKIPMAKESYPYIGAVLRLACKTIDRWIQKGDPERAMVCSQFVYHCYHSCGEKFAITITNGVLQAHNQAAGTRLADLCNPFHPENGKDLLEPLPEMDNMELDEAFFTGMQRTLMAAAQPNADALPLDPPSAFVKRVSEFDKKAQALAAQLQMPLDALFITPADLLLNAENLSLQGTMHVKWKEG